MGCFICLSMLLAFVSFSRSSDPPLLSFMSLSMLLPWVSFKVRSALLSLLILTTFSELWDLVRFMNWSELLLLLSFRNFSMLPVLVSLSCSSEPLKGPLKGFRAGRVISSELLALPSSLSIVEHCM